MAVYGFDKLQVSLRVADIPVGYAPPRGPAVDFLVRYNQRDIYQPATFTYANLGPKWTLDYLSYVTDTPGQPSVPVTVYPRGGGGQHTYSNYDSGTQTYAAHWRTNATLVRTSASPIQYERRLPDGSVEVFDQPDGATTAPRRVFMTESRDPQGNALHFTYDSSLRLVAITDAIGQVTSVSYQLASDPLKITKVTDPFGRFATFTYDNGGELEQITDVIGMKSSFRYTGGTFIGAMTTPYGTTTFRRNDLPERWLEATDPLGATERLEYWHHIPDYPTEAPSGEVPTGFTSRNTALDFANSVYWDKLAYARHPGNLDYAVITKWERGPTNLMVLGVRHSEKRPFENRTWYAYPDQSFVAYIGRLTTPAKVARVLDDSTSQIWEADYNTAGFPTTLRDPLGREATYVYASNGIDLIEVRQTTSGANDLLATFSGYDARHRPASMTDAAGETTDYTYNSYGQRLTATNAKGEITTWAYDGNGYLTSVTGPVSGATNSLAYDAYGRIRTVTGPDAYALTLDYDAFDRPTRVTYPNDQTTLYTYLNNANDRRLQTIHHKTPSNATLSKFDYTYDAVGNILTWQQQANAADPTKWAYGYDASDQLLNAVKRTTDSTPTVLARYGYRYDPAGNRTAEQVDDVVTGATFNTLNGLETHTAAGALRVPGTLNEPASVTIDGVAAAIDGENSFVGVKQLTTGTNTFTVAAKDPAGNTQTKTYEVDADGASRTFMYDDNGNLTSDGTRTFEWDAQNRLLAVESGTHRSEFTYDGFDRRSRIVEKEDNSVVRDAALFWAGTQIIEERLSTSEVNRFFANGEDHDGVARYLTRDHLGSVREVTNSGGSVVTRNDYDPYGRLTRVSGTEDSRFGFTGHYVHEPTGLVLALYRAYDPGLGRWLNQDPAGMINGPNMFAYVSANPLGLVDLLGLCAPEGGDDGAPPPAQNGPPEPDSPSTSPAKPSSSAAPARTPARGEPNTQVRFPGPGGNTTDRTYGPDGRATKDIDRGHDHNGTGDPHAHDWDWGKVAPRQPARPLTPEETAALATALTVLYWVVSESSRILFPPRNLIPLP